MTIPFKYNLRNLRVRWRSTLATAMGIALVVGVFVLILSMARGLRGTFLSTGDVRNLLVIRRGALAESSSQLTLDEVRRIKFLEGIAQNPKGEPLASAELIILITLQRASGGKAHVQVRGLGPVGGELRPAIRVTQGRIFQPGQRECIVSQSMARRFPECALGRSFRSGKHSWSVVGIFDARKTAYDSEVWTDADEAREAFNRTFYSSLVLRPADAAGAEAVRRRIEGDKQLQLQVLTEREYHQQQTKTAAPIQFLGVFLATIMCIGAVFSAMNTLYASIGARAREIGTLRVLGFRPAGIYVSFLAESVVIALAGGVVGCLLALPLHGLAAGTFNWATFAEVAFEFSISAGVLIGGMVFALVMGVLGGLLPARAAAKRPILDCLRD